ncbi:MAG: hypothetical protein KDD45_10285, partial [Bdellovibrionales bacterium]|nr:hypothetical protein [Bdellovibrionales bacterium]
KIILKTKKINYEVFMKMSLSINALSKENQFLKLTTKLLFAIVFILILQVIFLYNRDPILIQSSTRGLQIVEPLRYSPSKEDIKFAIEVMLKARFNTQVFSPELYLSDKQKLFRINEQKEFKSRNMTQTIIIRQIDISKSEALIEMDRVIAVGDVRSAIKTKLKIVFEESEPNELNPYGLVLSLVEVQNTSPNNNPSKNALEEK